MIFYTEKAHAGCKQWKVKISADSIEIDVLISCRVAWPYSTKYQYYAILDYYRTKDHEIIIRLTESSEMHQNFGCISELSFLIQKK